MKKIVFFISLCFLTHQTALSESHTCGTEDPIINNKLIADINEQQQNNFWKEDVRHNLTFCISDKFYAEKETISNAVFLAIDEWEQYANVKFQYLPGEDSQCDKNNQNVLFRVRVENSRRVPYSARAFFPYATLKKRQMIFKRKIVKGSFSTLLGITIHEFGHVLGFRHEHIHDNNPKSCKEKRGFNPLTDYDSSSIMHYLICGGTGSLLRLSEKDKLGASIAYP